MHEPDILSPPVLVRDWAPVFPAGTLRAVSLHWTAGSYESVFGAYHFCLSGATDVRLHATHDLRANMRELGSATGPYAAHTHGRNSFSVGIAICAMAEATPHDFNRFPLTADQIEALCRVTARVLAFYCIDLAAVRTHAEAAVDDGYFGAQSDDVRWDIARLQAAPDALQPAEATAVGARLRSRIAELA